MFGPPVNRAMRILDRSFFKKKIPLADARVFDKKAIAKYRSNLNSYLLNIDPGVPIVRQDPYLNDLKILLLKPEIRPDSTFCPYNVVVLLCLSLFLDPETWSSTLQELAKERQIAVAPYDLELSYEHWNYRTYVGSMHN